MKKKRSEKKKKVETMLNVKYIIFFFVLLAVSVGLLYVGFTQMMNEPVYVLVTYLSGAGFMAGLSIFGIAWFCCRHKCRRNIIYSEVSDAETENFPEAASVPSNFPSMVRPPPPAYYPQPSSYAAIPPQYEVVPMPPEGIPVYQNSPSSSFSPQNTINQNTPNIYEVPPESFYSYGKSPVYSSSPPVYK